MSQPFASVAMTLYERGYNVLPIAKNSKSPFFKNWQEWCNSRQAAFQVESWLAFYPDYNIGLPLGPANGVVAIDFDHDENGAHAEIINLLEGSPCRKKGAKGFTSFYRYNGEPKRKWYVNGKAVVELLSTGNQTVLPPSIHPDTKQPYLWLTPESLGDITASELPFLPADFVEKVDRILGYKERVASFAAYEYDKPDLADVRDALSYIPSDEYATWLHIGMALHYNYGDAGLQTWDDWSRKAHNYDAEAVPKKWNSFRAHPTPVTVSTIFHHAIGLGYIPKARFEIGADFKITINGVDMAQKQPLEAPKQQETVTVAAQVIPAVNIPSESQEMEFPADLLDAPGLIGKIADWINSTAYKRQPVLALGAAIAATGTIYAHRVRSVTDLRTNFMVLGLCPSGGGKEHARECIDQLFEYCGLSHLLLGDFASDVGLLSSIRKNGGVGLALMDEIGREMKALNARSAGSHESRILTTMMKVFSKANGTYRGKEYANHDGKAPRLDVHQPNLCIYGTTVPKHFYDSLTSAEAIDGFLSRWLVFESRDPSPQKQQRGDIATPPGEIVDWIRRIQDMPTGPEIKAGHIPTQAIIKPAVIAFSGVAEDYLADLEKAADENRLIEFKNGNGLDAIWSRTREHAIKLALAAHEEGIIESSAMAWACRMAMWSSQYAISRIKESVSDSEHQRLLKRVLDIIRGYNSRFQKPMAHRALCHQTTFIKARERNEILAQLAESEMIAVDTTVVSNNQRHSYMATESAE
jgi:hypothetical protein